METISRLDTNWRGRRRPRALLWMPRLVLLFTWNEEGAKSSRTRTDDGRVHKMSFTHWQTELQDRPTRRREAWVLRGRGSSAEVCRLATVWWLDWNLFQFQRKPTCCSVIWEWTSSFSMEFNESSVTPAQPTLLPTVVVVCNGVRITFTDNWQWQIQIEQDLRLVKELNHGVIAERRSIK